jgi:hypothetical protein
VVLLCGNFVVATESDIPSCLIRMATGWPQTSPDTGGLILEGPHVRIASVLGVFLGLGWVFFSLRMYVRAFITGNWGLDDMLLIIAIVSSMATTLPFLLCSCSNFSTDDLHSALYSGVFGDKIFGWDRYPSRGSRHGA